MAKVLICHPVKYGEGGYGKYDYKNNQVCEEIDIPDIEFPIPDLPDWLVDQFREDYLNG